MTNHATEAALYKRRWEEECEHSADLARQVDQAKLENAELVAANNALAAELQRLRGEEGDAMAVEPPAPKPPLKDGAKANPKAHQEN